ncbi:ATP-binding protein [Nonomuraea bangladeshensis]|uniref:ATP-binding protein n=2 Tax=Nonomuraea TaxID=83681 RepID=A0ABV3GYT9_9ACTN
MIQEVPRTDMEHIGTIELTRDDQAPRLAREAVTGWVGRSHPARDTLILAASELVTNAVVHADHGHGRHWLLIHLARASDLFRLAVTDPGTALSAPHHVPLQIPRLDRNAEQGRGLAIVAALSRGRWGSHLLLPHSRHRVVWCYLDAQPSESDIELLYSAAMCNEPASPTT